MDELKNKRCYICDKPIINKDRECIGIYFETFGPFKKKRYSHKDCYKTKRNVNRNELLDFEE